MVQSAYFIVTIPIYEAGLCRTSAEIIQLFIRLGPYMRKRLHWFSYQPTPYNDFLFNQLGKDSDFDLTVHYRAPSVSSHPWKSEFGVNYRWRTYQTKVGIDWQAISLVLKEPHAFFIIAGWDHPTTLALLSLLMALRRPFAVWTDTPDSTAKRGIIKGRVRAQWLRLVFRSAQTVLATGKPGIHAVIEMGAPAERACSFPFWLDLSSYRRSDESPLLSHGFHILSSGRLQNSLKGHDLALKAVAKAAKNWRVNWQYTLAGTGVDMASLKELARELGISKQVHFVGWAEPRTLIDLYLKADVVLHPSPKHDPFPNAVLEGMAAGCIVLASDVSGSAVDRIQNGKNGFLHRAGDWEQISEQLSAVLFNIEEHRVIGANARKTAELWPVERGVETIRNVTHGKRTPETASS